MDGLVLVKDVGAFCANAPSVAMSMTLMQTRLTASDGRFFKNIPFELNPFRLLFVRSTGLVTLVPGINVQTETSP